MSHSAQQLTLIVLGTCGIFVAIFMMKGLILAIPEFIQAFFSELKKLRK